MLCHRFNTSTVFGSLLVTSKSEFSILDISEPLCTEINPFEKNDIQMQCFFYCSERNLEKKLVLKNFAALRVAFFGKLMWAVSPAKDYRQVNIYIILRNLSNIFVHDKTEGGEGNIKSSVVWAEAPQAKIFTFLLL